LTTDKRNRLPKPIAHELQLKSAVEQVSYSIPFKAEQHVSLGHRFVEIIFCKTAIGAEMQIVYRSKCPAQSATCTNSKTLNKI
jgi:hypothetical protein